MPDFWSLTPHFGKNLVVFEPVVGDFYEHFSKQGFFDSFVGLTKQEEKRNE